MLDLGHTEVSSLEALRGLSYLEEVTLFETKVEDLSPLLELPALKTVGISKRNDKTGIADILRARGVEVRYWEE
jgi:hypothetical protein